MRLSERIAESLLKPVNEVVTVMLGVFTMVWGLWLVSPFWDVFSTAALYSQLLDLIPAETVWGLIAISAGVATLLGLTRHMPRIMFFGAGASGWHWLMIAILYFIGDWHNTGGIVSVFLCLLSMYIYLNCKMSYLRAKEIEEENRHIGK